MSQSRNSRGPGKNALIIANGSPPPVGVLRSLAAASELIVCADGGARHALRARVTPNVILGDMDSLAPSVRKSFRRVPLLRIPDQSTTDLEKAILFCLKQGYSKIDIAGGIGNRIDHSTGALGCFLRFRRRARLREIHREGTIIPVGKMLSLHRPRGSLMSLIPLHRCKGVTSANLRYPLRNASLELGIAEGISNVVTGSPVTVRVRSGVLLAYVTGHPR